MPKTAAYSLFWQEEQQTYQLYLTKNKTLLDLSAGSPAWFLLLEQIDSLTFRGRNGHCTVRKESRKRGNGYWYAYQSRGKHLYKQYIGKAAHLTAERLEEVVQQLAARYNPPQGPPEQQSNPLLLAKFSVPHPQHQLVARTHLLEQIERGVQGPLTLISAPAGFGKTTILAQWFQQKKMPAVWLSLEAQDNHPTRFLRYVITALQQFDPELGRDLLVLLQSGRPAQTESLLTLLANEITTRCIPCIVLILDDYHVITAEAIHQQLAFFCEHPASRLRLVLLTRADPPLPLARLRAYGQLTELRASQLRFDSQETTAFLQSVMGLELSDDNLRLLEQRTEGWVAGLQLAALSLRGQTDVAAYLRDLGGSNRFILDYLSDEVISHLPASTLDFLLNTCILERLNDSLCAAVLQREPAQVRGMLASLERSNLFVIALDENGTWYRYHHLFSTMLQARLAQSYPGHSAELHRRASLWYQQNGYENEAMHHALLTRDISRVLELLKTSAWEMLQRGEHQLLLEWLERIPRQLEREQPLLCLYHAATLAFLTQIGAAQEMLHYAEHPLNREAELAPPGEIAAVRLLIASVKGDLDQAEQAAQLALSQLSPERNFLQRLVRGSQALMYARKGKCALAIEMLYAAAGPTWTIDQAVGLAYLYVELGRLQKTMSICQETLASLRKGGVPPSLPYLGAISILLGLVSYERNECEDALSFLHEGIEHCKKMGEPIFLSLGYIIIAHIRLFQHTFMQPCPEPDAEMLELVRQARDLLRQQRLEMYWVSSGAPWLLQKAAQKAPVFLSRG
jgi:LuxR family maltose regulon positive regulatory protein